MKHQLIPVRDGDALEAEPRSPVTGPSSPKIPRRCRLRSEGCIAGAWHGPYLGSVDYMRAR